MVVAAILAAGSGERFGRDKMQALVDGEPLWFHAYRSFRMHPEVHEVLLVVSEATRGEFPDHDPHTRVVLGGSSRQDSARAALEACSDEAEMLLFQDAARPFTSPNLISSVVEAVRRTGAAAPAVPISDTIREVGSQRVVDRSSLVAMQTPQGARLELWRGAFAAVGVSHTDDMALLSAAGVPFELVAGDPENFKVTLPSDLERARAKMSGMGQRSGIGYDVHRFSTDPSRKLYLGGLHFRGARGLEGHSDADVVLHAVVDALLGAAALGDIGHYFPPSKPKWKNTSSSVFVEFVRDLLTQKGYEVVNVDLTIIAEHPKIGPKSVKMREQIADMLNLRPDQISVKATTNEGLGSIGRGEGIAAFATATIRQ